MEKHHHLHHPHPRQRSWLKWILALLVLAAAIGIGLWIHCSGIPKGPLRLGLDFEKSVFAKVSDKGDVTILEKAEYERGESVNFALMKVGKFQKGADGKHWVDMDMKVWDGNKMIFEKAGLLGEGGKVELKDGFAESPTGVFTATASLKPGDYTMGLWVYDKIGGGKAYDAGVFTVK